MAAARLLDRLRRAAEVIARGADVPAAEVRLARSNGMGAAFSALLSTLPDEETSLPGGSSADSPFAQASAALSPALDDSQGANLAALSHQASRRERAETQLRDAERRYQTLVDRLPAVVYSGELGLAGRTFYVSPQIEALLGYSREAWLADPELWFRLVHPDDRPRVAQLNAQALAGGERLAHEYRLLAHDGRVVWVRDEGQITRRSAGQAAVVEGFLLDITERRRAETAVLRRGAILQAVGAVARIFLETESWEQALPPALARLGEAAGVSRAYLFQMHLGADEILRTSQRGEWTAPGIAPQLDNAELQNLPLVEVGYGRWVAELQQGRPIHGRVPDFPPAERALLEAQDIQSLAVMPVFAGGAWWGFIGCDDCLAGEKWSAVELDALQAAAGALGAAIQRASLLRSEREQRALAEALRDAAAALNSTLDDQVVLDRILGSARRVVPYETASIALLEGGLVRFVRSAGYAERGLAGWLAGLRLHLDTDLVLRRVAGTGQPIVVPDCREDPDWELFPETAWIHSFVSAPIRLQGETIGFLNLDSATPGFYGAADAAHLQAFADQAAAAIANARLLADARRGAEQQRLLFQAAQDFTIRQDEAVVLRAVARHLTRILRADRCAVSLWEREQDRVVTHFQYDASPRPPTARLPDAPGTPYALADYPATRQVLESRRPRVIARGDPAADPAEQALLEEVDISVALLLPLAAADRVFGLLEVYRKEPAVAFSPGEVQLAETLATQAAVALDNARLYAATQQQAAELAALYRASGRLIGFADLSGLAAHIAEAVTDEFGMAHCGVLALDETTGSLALLAQAGDLKIANPPALTVSSPGLIAAAARSGELVYSPRVADDPRYLPGIPSTCSELDLPLKVRGRVVGVLNLESAEPEGFDATTRRLMAAFAERAALALENAGLLDAISAHARHMALLNDITAAALVAADFHHILQTLADRLGELFGADGCFITLWDAERQITIPAAAYGELRQTYRRGSSIASGELTMTASVLRAGRPLAADDVFHSPHLSPRIAGQYPTRSLLGLPLIADGTKLGAALIGFNQPHHFTPAEIALGEQAAGPIALAVAKARLVDKLEMAALRANQLAVAATESSRLKSEFLANTSHELRTPLTGILGSLSIVLDGLADSPDEERQFIGIAQASARRLLETVNSILDLAKIEAGRMMVEPQAMEVAGLLDEIYLLTHIQAKEKGLTLGIDPIQPPIPVAWADPGKVKQILLNLAANAIKFTERGEVRLTACVAPAVSGHGPAARLLISVRDTGIGIPLERQGRLFQPFVQADGSTTRKYGGTGLGLSISRRLAEAMGGTLTLHSAGAGHGSTFTLALPLANHTPAG